MASYGLSGLHLGGGAGGGGEDGDEEGGERERMYAWEGALDMSWVNVKMDEEGRLISEGQDQDEHLRRQQHELNRRKLALGQCVRRGLIRYLFLGLDASASMREMDLKPERLRAALKLCQEFVKEYFDQNPISQLGLLVTKQGEAERLTDLSANPKSHIAKLQDYALRHRAEGEASLQNLLELALSSLKAIPDYGNREVVLVYGSLTTCDPGDIFETLKKLVKARVRVSIISLSAEMYICRKVCEDTNGTYAIALDGKHFVDLLMAQVAPPPTTTTAASKGPLYMDMVLMGFPNRVHTPHAPTLAFDGANPPRPTTVAHVCPRCQARVADLPTACNVCTLPLVSSSHLARSYHHLFPVIQYTEVPSTEQKELDTCHACMRRFDVASLKVVRLQCPTCRRVFCLDCDMYIHESLHNCPGCCG